MSKKTKNQQLGPLRHLGEALKRLRESKGMSQSEVAAKAELHPSAISRYESGASGMWVETLGRILLALDCDVMDLARQLRARSGPIGLVGQSEDGVQPSANDTSNSIIIESLVERVRHLGKRLVEAERERDSLAQEVSDLRRQLSGTGEETVTDPQDTDGGPAEEG